VKGAAKTMTLLRPNAAAEALALYAATPGAVALAGGTDFMVAWNAGHANGRTILDLSGLAEWRKLRVTKSALTIGSLVTFTRLREDAVTGRRFPLLVEASASVGGAQIQNRGTLGGNVANASPAGDSFPPLAVYEAVVIAASASGSRRIPFAEIFAGVKRTTLQPGELIEAIEIPFLAKRPSRQLFRKIGTRAAQAISKTVVAGLLWLGRDGRVEELRFALGAMAPTVRRLTRAEALVRGKRLTPEVVRQACALLAEDVSPIDDFRSTAEYRLLVSQNLLASFLGTRA
jgi:CO/xanthine dehydrogenase FAD-binding subunit